MGATFSKSNALRIQIKPTYAAGETMEGVVAFNCIEKFNVKGIMLEVRGYEYISFSTQQANNNTMYHSGTNEFFKITVSLGPAGVMNPGQYQFGFKLTLPATLPPSFKLNYGGSSGELTYEAKAWVAKPGMTFDIKTKTEFQVVGIPPESSPPGSNASEEKAKVCCCFGGQGTGFIQANIDKTVFVPGETVTVAVQARNTSGSKFDGINIKLIRFFQVATESQFYYRRHVYPVVVQKTPGLAPGERLEGSMAKKVQLQIPVDAQPSIYGDILQSYYAIEAELHGSFAVSAIRTQVQVRICTTIGNNGVLKPPPGSSKEDESDALLTAAPSNWKPEVYPTVDIPPPSAKLQYKSGSDTYYRPPSAKMTAPIV